jgi:phosphatidylserine/phosphatidylglycerophosphate/cardiolipin synthase-like enzyme
MITPLQRHVRLCALSFTFVTVVAVRAATAQPYNANLCDSGQPTFSVWSALLQANQTLNCRTRLMNLIKAEQVRIDVAFWFMEDQRYVAELVKKKKAGVPVRLIIDPRANVSYPYNKLSLDTLTACSIAGDPCIPARKRTASGILHWKFMLFHGQGKVQFSAGNYSDDAFVPVVPYTNYVDEAIYFTDKPAIVHSFMTKFDDAWTNTSSYADYRNITSPPTRVYAPFPIDPELNFPPGQSYATRAVNHYNAETTQIDVTIYRITDLRHSDAMIAAHQRGVPIRLYTDTYEYRNKSRLWHAWNVDRMWLAGQKPSPKGTYLQIKIPAHAGMNHQKSMQLHGQRLTIFGSSNWTSPSANSQAEHNYFTKDPDIWDWFRAQFERKWNNQVAQETKTFIPLPPDTATYKTPANGAVGAATSGTSLVWYAGPWAHLYDVYFGTSSTPPLVASNLDLGPSQSTSDVKKFALPPLAAGRTYYWKIVSKTAALKTKTGPIWSFRTAG